MEHTEVIIPWDYRMLMRRWGQEQLYGVRGTYELSVCINQLGTEFQNGRIHKLTAFCSSTLVVCGMYSVVVVWMLS